MGRTRLFANDTDDDTSSEDNDADMDNFVTSFRPLRFSRLRAGSRVPEESSEGTSGLSRQRGSTRPGLETHLRRRVAVNRSNSSSNSASNSPRQPGPSSPKLARLSASRSSLFSPNNRTVVLSSDTSPSPLFCRRGVRRAAVESDEEHQGATAMSTGSGTAADCEEPGVVRDTQRRRMNRFWSGMNSRRTSAATTSSNDSRRSRQQQMDADEAYARRLQAQFDAQFQAEQQQRRRREAAAQRRHARVHANSFRPSTPPPQMRDMMGGALSEDDDYDDDDFRVQFAISNILEQAVANTDQEYPRRRNQRRGSPTGPTTLATVRRYFREAHLDANAFPDISISVLGFEALLELADEIGDAAPSMSNVEINRLPTTIYRQTVCSIECFETSSASSSTGSASCSDDTPTCAICMEKFTDGDVQRNLPCFHAFHKDCVDVWLKQRSSCPVCRVDARQTSPSLSP